MPQSLANLLVHRVFSTKDRRPFLQDTAKRAAVHRYLAGVSARLPCPRRREVQDMGNLPRVAALEHGVSGRSGGLRLAQRCHAVA